MAALISRKRMIFRGCFRGRGIGEREFMAHKFPEDLISRRVRQTLQNEVCVLHIVDHGKLRVLLNELSPHGACQHSSFFHCSSGGSVFHFFMRVSLKFKS